MIVLTDKDKMCVAELKANGIWPMHYISAIGLIPVLQKRGEHLRGAEIGVCRGENIARFLEDCPNIVHIDAVDPFMAYDDPNGGMDQAMMDVFHALTLRNFAEHPARVTLHRMRSAEYAAHVPDQSLDYVFIDGDHSYAAVCEDLRAWYPKIKTGGIFSGHDVLVKDVQRAIVEFREEVSLTAKVKLCDHSVWYWVKE